MKNGQEGLSSHRWSYRSLSRLGWLLPVGALTFFLLLVFAVPRDRHAPASDLDTGLVLLALCLVPIAALAGIVLTVLARVRAQRVEPSPGVGAILKLLVPIAVAVGCVAITVGLVWITLEAGAAFR